MNRDLLVKNGDIVTAERRFRGDVRCRGGRIVEVGPDLGSATGETEVDATGLLVLPGGIDPHVHLELPVAGTVSSDDFESGTAAALAGGTTTVVDFVHPQRGESPLAALAARRRQAEAAVVDYGLHMAVTWWGDGVAAAMERCVRQEGIPTFKVYLAYRETVGLDDDDLVAVLAAAGRLPARVLVHAEHGPIIEHLRTLLAERGELGPSSHPRSRPPEAEGEATGRAAVLAHLTGAALYVVHVTCRQAVEALAQARAEGWEVAGETCPQYLLLDDTVYGLPGFRAAAYVVSPPIRRPEHQEVLWRAVADGTLAVVATDHCPFDLHGQKDLGRDDFRRIPGGAAGIEHRLSLLFTHGVVAGRLGLEAFVDRVSTGPAKLFGLHPRKGEIAPGSDADLVLWDAEAGATISASTHRHRCDTSIYEGFSVRGLPATVIAAGEIRYDRGELRARRGCGRYLRRELRTAAAGR